MERLRSYRCDLVQGYFFAKSMPYDELVKKYLDHPLTNFTADETHLRRADGQ